MKKLLTPLAISLSLLGCKDDPRIAKTAQELKQAQDKIVQIENELITLRSAVNKDRETYAWDKFMSAYDTVAYLTPGADGYSALRFDLGVLTVSLVDVKPYANGAKVTLQFGNTLAATINGLKAKIDWGKTDENGSPINDQAKSKEVKFNESIKPGAWTKVSVVLDGVAASEFGFVRVSNVSHAGIELVNRR